MALDPSIILRAGQTQITPADPLEQYSKAMTLKALMGQGQLQGLQTEKATRDLDRDKRVEALFSANPKATAEDVMAIDPQRGFAFRKLTQESAKAEADLQKTRQEITSKAVAQHRDSLANVNDPQTAAQWVQAGYTDPLLAPILSKGGDLQAALSRIPQDPAAFQAWKQQNALGATKFIELNKPHVMTQDTGGASNIVSTPGLGGAPQILSTTKKTMTPDAVASNSLGRAHLAVTAATADPFGTLGIRDIAARAGAGSGGPASAAGTVAGGTGGVTPAGQAAAAASMTGDQYLATLPKQMADQVKGLAEGRMQFPAGFALKAPYWQQMIQSVSQYDPNFDAVNYNSRAGVRKDFTSGKSATSLNALNTVMGHLDELEKSSTALNNTDYPMVNKALNTVGAQVSPDLKGRLNAFKINVQAVASELERAYRGTGGNMTEIEEWKRAMDAADSPQAIRAGLRQATKLLGSKIDALGDQYSKGMGTTKDGLELLTPKAKATYARLSGDAGAQPEKPAGPSQADIDAELRRRGAIK